MVMTATSEMVMSGDPRICERSLGVVGTGRAVPFGRWSGVWGAAPFGADQIGQRGGRGGSRGAGRLVIAVDGRTSSGMFLAWIVRMSRRGVGAA